MVEAVGIGASCYGQGNGVGAYYSDGRNRQNGISIGGDRRAVRGVGVCGELDLEIESGVGEEVGIAGRVLAQIARAGSDRDGESQYRCRSRGSA